MRVAVINPPLLLGGDFIDYPWFAGLGALHGAGAVRQAGHEVRLLDAFSTRGSNLYPYEPGVQLWGTPVPRLLAPLESWPPDLVVIHHPPFLHLERDNPIFAQLLRLLRHRAPEAPLVLADGYLGAMHYLAEDRAALLSRYPELDYACQYETELVLCELIAKVAAGEAPARDAPAAQRVFRQQREAELDSLALPAWDLISTRDFGAFLEGVFDRTQRANPFRIAPDSRPLITSRGCVHRCIFCTTNPWTGEGEPRHFRRLSLPRLREHLRLLRREQNAHHLAVLDQAANLNPDFSAVLDDFARAGFVYDFPNGLRADLLRDEHLDRMRERIGTLSISAESGNQRVVDEIVGKRLDLSHVRRVAAAADARGIPTVVHFTVGLPGESRQEILDTFEFALDLFERHGAEPLVSYATPMKGTPLWKLVRAMGLEDRTEQTAPAERVQHLATVGTGHVSAQEITSALGAFRRRVETAQTRKVILNLTYRCNNHCSFCAVGGEEDATSEGDTATLRVGIDPVPLVHADIHEVLRALERYYMRGARLVDFDGGEPLLHPHVLQAIRHARRVGYEYVSLTTNGRLLRYEGTAAKLLASGVHALLVSVHGPNAALHDALTRAPGAFAQTRQGLENVRRLMATYFGLAVNTTVVRDNLASLGELGDMLLEIGVPHWNLQLVTPYGRATPGLVPDAEEVRRLLPPVLDRFRAHMGLKVINAPPCLLPGYEDFVVGDIGKAERNMVFATRGEVNLASFLATRRVHGERCVDCLLKPACAGEYRFEEDGE